MFILTNELCECAMTCLPFSRRVGADWPASWHFAPVANLDYFACFSVVAIAVIVRSQHLTLVHSRSHTKGEKRFDALLCFASKRVFSLPASAEKRRFPFLVFNWLDLLNEIDSRLFISRDKTMKINAFIYFLTRKATLKLKVAPEVVL